MLFEREAPESESNETLSHREARLEAPRSVCGSRFSLAAPTCCVPQEVELIMFDNTTHALNSQSMCNTYTGENPFVRPAR